MSLDGVLALSKPLLARVGGFGDAGCDFEADSTNAGPERPCLEPALRARDRLGRLSSLRPPSVWQRRQEHVGREQHVDYACPEGF